MLKVLSESGNFVKDEVWQALIDVISNASDLHGYTVRSLHRVFQASVEQECLVLVAVWCMGEYGEMLVYNVGMLDIEEPMTVTESHNSSYGFDCSLKAFMLFPILFRGDKGYNYPL
ncbi:hypothetical protein PVL29_022916 [Vitis rotundifolia]|uniref:Clathrin/coatomer adaptor adaptin-like N-terminal domain-containing protein n=1 Tax=Vitis rotundifolia TaxID=103349 RepID=A0AA39DBZ0_VITRO|nr:hypothetical protein PVL29_022916 [Vitis rotundifolia]